MVARVIIVDDVAQNVRLLEEILVSAYYEVKSIDNGAALVPLAHEWQPDAVLLDVLMPGVGGYEACRLLKDNPSTAHIPVIMITALREAPDRLEALEAGADEFLSKPIDHQVLLARVRSVVRLKRLMDELRTQGAVAATLGLAGDSASIMCDSSCNILIVDDDMNFGPRFEKLLGQSGSAVIVEPDEANAIDLARAMMFDLIIISLQLAEGDPLRLLARLRAADATRDTPILLIAEPGSHDQLIVGLDLGANDCVMLPVDDTELVVRARNHVRRKRYQDRLRSDLGSAFQLAVVDPLTGLFNRRYLMNFLNEVRPRTPGNRIAVLLADVDHFKSINDRFGHQAGDSVLKSIAATLRAGIRGGDLVVRYGGEEFLVVVTQCQNKIALAVAERLRAAIERTKVDFDAQFTASIGIAIANDGEPAESLIERADRALYSAKRAGRNCVVLDQPKLEYGEVLRTTG